MIYQVDDDALRRKLQAYGPDLEDMVGAGFHSFAEKGDRRPGGDGRGGRPPRHVPGLRRSWKRRPDVGQDAEYPDLTLRDAAAVRSRGA